MTVIKIQLDNYSHGKDELIIDEYEGEVTLDVTLDGDPMVIALRPDEARMLALLLTAQANRVDS